MTTLITLAVLSVLALLYLNIFRPWQLRWGATDEEIERDMPGDNVVNAPSFNATRAVTINALAEHIYPWIVQIGVTRAGWYSYDVLDNLARHSAETILPEHQKIQVGDIIPMSPDGKDGLYVKDFEENEWILWWDNKGDNSWVWGMYPDKDGHSRLVTPCAGEIQMAPAQNYLQATD